MNKQLQYKGYIGDVNYDPEGKYYYGQIQNISAAVGYDGNNLLELEEDFHTGGILVMPATIPHAVYAVERFKMLLTVVFPVNRYPNVVVVLCRR